MLRKRTLWIALLGILLVVPGASRLRASDDDDAGEDRVIVLGDDDSNDWDVAGDFDVADLDLDAVDPVIVKVDRDHGRGWLGVRLMDLTPELREYFGTAKDAGVLVGSVEADSPAAKAGVKVGDVVTAADGERIESPRDLSRAVRRKKSGDTVKLDVSRDRAKKQISVTVADRPGREIRIGELGPKMRHRVWNFRDGDFDTDFGKKLAPFHDMGRLQERLEDLEKRLKELERKLPAK
jgi:membrane-associated protease RseP (regulator of RpoE activity)